MLKHLTGSLEKLSEVAVVADTAIIYAMLVLLVCKYEVKSKYEVFDMDVRIMEASRRFQNKSKTAHTRFTILVFNHWQGAEGSCEGEAEAIIETA